MANDFMKWLIGTTSDHDQEHAHLQDAIKNLTDADRTAFANHIQDALDAVKPGNGTQQLMLRLARHQLYQLILELVEADRKKEDDDDD